MDKIKEIVNELVCNAKKIMSTNSPKSLVTLVKSKTGKGGDTPGSVSPKAVGIPMKFPYTFSAKIAQFPWKFYMKNNWIYRYYLAGLILGLPVFIKLHNLSNSQANKDKWAEIRRKEELEHQERFE